MARKRSEKVEEVKARLQARLGEGVYRPGDRFLSTRAVAAKFEISYQTAHRIIQELSDEGFLERRAASGTYIPGGNTNLLGAQLIFNPRAKRKSSFGARLLEELTQRLEREKLSWKMTWANEETKIANGYFPVIWECPAVMDTCAQSQQGALLLNHRPPPGLGAAFLDSVSSDDFSGGVCAAQLLLRAWENEFRVLESRGLACQARAGENAPQFAILSGPANDIRSEQRCNGFSSLAPNAACIVPRDWFFEDGYRVAKEAIVAGRDGLFCCNDRLAQSVLAYCRERDLESPRIVGFDDAPIAEILNLTTISIPWTEMIAGAVGIIKRRLSGDTSSASQQIFPPRPIIRKL